MPRLHTNLFGRNLVGYEHQVWNRFWGSGSHVGSTGVGLVVQVDFYIAGFPCKAFSRLRTSTDWLKDREAEQFWEVKRTVQQIRPKAWESNSVVFHWACFYCVCLLLIDWYYLVFGRWCCWRMCWVYTQSLMKLLQHWPKPFLDTSLNSASWTRCLPINSAIMREGAFVPWHFPTRVLEIFPSPCPRSEFGTKTSTRKYYFFLINRRFLAAPLSFGDSIDATAAALRASAEACSIPWLGAYS